MQPLEVRLFGGFALRRGDEIVPPIASRVARSLFGYLAVHLGSTLPRDRLVAQFWPDLVGSRGRRRLSHTLWQLQDVLSELPGGTEYLEVGADSLGIGTDAPVTVDVVEFERGLDEVRHPRSGAEVRPRDLVRLERVVELYRGDLLDGHYEPWVREEQERLGQRYLEAVAALVAMAKRLGAYEDALLYARRLTHQDPLREDGHREVMRLSMLLGRPGEALRQFERCREVLAEELGADPSPSTLQLHERILRQGGEQAAAVASVPFPQRPPLVGRDRDRAAALTVLDSALAGQGGAVLVEGEPGLGKSRLLEELIDDAGWRGFLVTSGRCRPLEEAGPFAVVRELIEVALNPLRLEHLRNRVEPVWLAEAARLVPALGRAIEQPSPRGQLPGSEGAERLRSAVLRVLRALAEIDPLLLVVDDAQWADDDSLAVLAAVARELPETSGALVLGYRSRAARGRSSVWQMIQELDRDLRPARILLTPLDAFSIGELARNVARGHRIEPAAAARLRRETGGNPLFVVETLRELTHQGRLDVLGEEDTELPVPVSIRALVQARVARSSPEARHVLDTIAVLGDHADLDTLEAATALPRDVLVGAVDDLLRASLVRDVADAYGPHHDQIRRTCLDAMEPEVARALHRRAGDALEQHRPAEVERIAHHLEVAGDGRRAASYLLAAGRGALSLYAYAAGAAYLERAAEQQQRGPFRVADRFDLLVELQAALDVLGRRDRQGEVIAELETLAGGEMERRAEVLRLRALLMASMDDPAGAIALADEAVALVEGAGVDASLGRCLRAAASVRGWAGRPEEAVPLWERAGGLAGEPQETIECRTLLASCLRELHRYDEAIEVLGEALVVAVEVGDLRGEAQALGVLGAIRMERGDLEEAVTLYERSLDRCNQLGFRRGQRINLINLGNAWLALLRPADALEAYTEAAAIARSLGDRVGLAVARFNAAAVLHEVLGDDDSAQHELERALAFLESAGERRFAVVCLEGLASIALRRDDLTAAAHHLEVAEEVRGSQADPWTDVGRLQRQAELAAARGEPAAAARLARQAAEVIHQHQLTGRIVEVQTLIARLLLSAGDVEGALEASELAVAPTLRGGRSYLAQLVRHDALLAAGDRAAARQALQTGATTLREMLAGLPPDLRQRAEGLEPHARLLALEAELAPRQIVREVAAAGAPSGRALRAQERVEVRVTLDPADVPADPVERRRAVLAEVVTQVGAQGGAATVADLAAMLEVSSATVRRDLAALRDRGESIVTRGHRAG